MDQLTLNDIEPLDLYMTHRAERQRAAIELRARRRVAVGDRVSLAFENRDTVRYQVQEMCRAEGIRDPQRVAHEVETYNQLVPGPGELSATLFIEVTDLARIKPELDRFLGLDRPGVLTLKVGPHLVPAAWEAGHSEEERIAAVQYVRFKLPAAARAAWREGAPVEVVIAHPRYQAAARLDEAARRELGNDLDEEPARP